MEHDVPAFASTTCSLREFVLVERALDPGFVLSSRRHAYATHTSVDERLKSELRYRVRLNALADRVEAAACADDDPEAARRIDQLVVAVLGCIGHHTQIVTRIHAAVVGGEPCALKIDVDHARALLRRGLLDAAWVARLGAALADLSERVIQVPEATRLLEAARRRAHQGAHVYPMLMLAEAAAEMRMAYLNLLMLKRPHDLGDATHALGEAIERATTPRAAAELEEWLGGRALGAAVIDHVTADPWGADPAPTPPELVQHARGVQAECGFALAAALACSILVVGQPPGRADLLSSEAHAAVCRLVGVRRLVGPSRATPVGSAAAFKTLADEGARQARARNAYELVGRSAVRDAVLGVADTAERHGVLCGLARATPLRCVLLGRIKSAALEALETGAPMRAPVGCRLAEPLCRAVDRLGALARLYASAI